MDIEQRMRMRKLTGPKQFAGGVLDEDPYEHLSEQCREVAYAGLQALQQLQQHSSSDALTNGQILVSLAAFSDGSEPWATDDTAALAKLILDEQLSEADKESFMVETILKGYLRSLFSKSRPGAITESGRKAAYRDLDLERERGLPDDSGKTKPWKYEDLRAIPAFSWAIRHADVCPPTARALHGRLCDADSAAGGPNQQELALVYPGSADAARRPYH